MISITQSGDPLENTMTKRVNGISKTELISSSCEDIDKASISTGRAMTIFNFKRRHSSLNCQIPHEVHLQKWTTNKALEKLLPGTKKNHAGNLIGQGKKISSLAVVAAKIFFATAQQKHF